MAAKAYKLGYLQLKAKDGRRYDLELIIAGECSGAVERSSKGENRERRRTRKDRPQFQNTPPIEEPPNEPGRPPVKEPPPEDPDREPPQKPPPGGPPVEEPPNEPGGPPVKEPPPEDPNCEPPQKPPVRAAPENRRRKSRSFRLIRSIFKPQSKDRSRIE